jgi:hypothetical protein
MKLIIFENYNCENKLGVLYEDNIYIIIKNSLDEYVLHKNLYNALISLNIKYYEDLKEYFCFNDEIVEFCNAFIDNVKGEITSIYDSDDHFSRLASKNDPGINDSIMDKKLSLINQNYLINNDNDILKFFNKMLDGYKLYPSLKEIYIKYIIKYLYILNIELDENKIQISKFFIQLIKSDNNSIYNVNLYKYFKKLIKYQDIPSIDYIFEECSFNGKNKICNYNNVDKILINKTYSDFEDYQWIYIIEKLFIYNNQKFISYFKEKLLKYNYLYYLKELLLQHYIEYIKYKSDLHIRDNKYNLIDFYNQHEHKLIFCYEYYIFVIDIYKLFINDVFENNINNDIKNIVLNYYLGYNLEKEIFLLESIKIIIESYSKKIYIDCLQSSNSKNDKLDVKKYINEILYINIVFSDPDLYLNMITIDMNKGISPMDILNEINLFYNKFLFDITGDNFDKFIEQFSDVNNVENDYKYQEFLLNPKKITFYDFCQYVCINYCIISDMEIVKNNLYITLSTNN